MSSCRRWALVAEEVGILVVIIGVIIFVVLLVFVIFVGGGDVLASARAVCRRRLRQIFAAS